MRILIVIALAIVGLLLGFWFWQVSDKFFAGAWERLLAPPDEIIELIPASDPPLYIKTSDGTTYRYEEWQNHGWIEAVVPQTSVNPTEVQRPCDLSAPEFSRWSNPPRDIVGCVQERVMYADGFIRYTFVLDNHGYLWQSRITRTAYGSMTTLLCFPGLGLLFGLVAGVLVAIHPWSRKVVKPSATV
jgi:hypothetical protein